MQTAQFQLHAQIEQRHWWFVARRRIVARLIEELLPPDPATTVVDVGCGTGANLAALANRYRCVGIDTSPEAIRLASERFSQVKFLCGVAPEGLGEEMDRARLVLLMDVLEHVSDDFALFSNLVAAARPGTYFLITVPADRRLWSQHDESFGHYRRYERQRLEQVWNGLPVSTLLCSAYNSRLFGAVKAARTWSRWRGRAAGAAGTDFRLPAAPLNRLLEALLAGEARRLVAALGGRSQQGYRRGVSLIAVLRREEGTVETRSKPADVPADCALVSP